MKKRHCPTVPLPRIGTVGQVELFAGQQTVRRRDR
jgi:hypothetical protein